MSTAYFIHLAIIVGIYLILSLSLQLSMGYGGLVNLGHIAFFGIGAYASALLTLNGFSFISAFFLAGIISMLFGFLISFPIRNIKGDYLALSTLSFTFVIYAIALNWTALTRGPLGIPGIPKPSILGFGFSSNISFLILVLVISILTYFFIRRLINSSFGKTLEAIRDNEIAVKSLGRNTFKVKLISLGVSSFFAGISGSLYAHYITYIDPSSFTIMQLIPILSIVIVGGLGSLKGTIIATILIILLPEPLRFVGFPSSVVGPMRQIIYALILVVIILYKPKGFFGKVKLD